jgi:hypothetical protein
MSGNERRINPRKDCAIPVRFRVLSDGSSRATERVEEGSGRVATMPATKVETMAGIHEGEAVNLSERGICFKSHEALAVGTSLEIYLKLPRELTGRREEEVRCSAHIVHVDSQMDLLGKKAIGASIERFEPVARLSSWAN